MRASTSLTSSSRDALDQQHPALMKALVGLSQQELSYKPDPQCMSIGFLAWQLARAQDFFLYYGYEMGTLIRVPEQNKF